MLSCASFEQALDEQVNDLLPGTEYIFYAVSLTVAGPSYENSSIVHAWTKSRGLVAGHYILIGFAVFIGLVLVVIGAFTCIRCCLLTFTDRIYH